MHNYCAKLSTQKNFWEPILFHSCLCLCSVLEDIAPLTTQNTLFGFDCALQACTLKRISLYVFVCYSDYVHAVTFPSVFGCNAVLKLKVPPFSRSVYTKTYENDVNKQKRFKWWKRCQRFVFYVWNVWSFWHFVIVWTGKWKAKMKCWVWIWKRRLKSGALSKNVARKMINVNKAPKH